jgi:hypothetical protein
MGLHDPFGHLNISYGQKKGWESNWQFDSSPLKIEKSPWFLYMQVANNIPLKNFQQRLKLFFTFHLNRRSTLWGLQLLKVVGVPTLGILRLPFGSFVTKWHLGDGLMARHRIYYKGGWWLPPNPGCGESCEPELACGSSMHQKCSNYALTNLLFGLCRSQRIIDVYHSS